MTFTLHAIANQPGKKFFQYAVMNAESMLSVENIQAKYLWNKNRIVTLWRTAGDFAKLSAGGRQRSPYKDE